MIKRLLAAVALSCALSAWAQVTPIVTPHVSFVTEDGGPCDGCKLYTYAAGSTTPLATYTDATGGSQNTNPVTLDPSGSANIWLGRNSYKFILKTKNGTTLWTADQVNAANLLPSGPAYSVQIANSGSTGLTSDPAIKISMVNHTLEVGTLPAAHVTIAPLGTPTSWTFDTSSATTARNSLGAGTGNVNSGVTGQVAVYPSNGTAVQGSTALPPGITATTQAASDNSTKVATTAFVFAPGQIGPTNLVVNGGYALTDNQGNGAKVQHSTGTATSGNLASFDANGNTVDSTYPATALTHQIKAVWNGNSCTLGDDGTGGSGCQGTQSWGSTVSGTYYVWCQPDYDSAASCSNIGNCSALLVDMVSHDSSGFTYYINSRTNTNRTHAVGLTCMAVN